VGGVLVNVQFPLPRVEKLYMVLARPFQEVPSCYIKEKEFPDVLKLI
jgi:hypothetical protein